jgi:hypothetical protein
VLRSKVQEEKIIDTETLEDYTIPYLEERAKRPGDKLHKYYLSEYYRRGHKVPQNFENALSWFKKLAEYCYRDSANRESSIEDYKQAYQNNPEAQYKVGKFLYAYQIDMPKAPLFWFMKAAEQGYVEAQSIVGIYCLEGMLLTTKVDKVNAKQQGLNYLLKAAHAENTKAQLALVAHYLSKENKDSNQALCWMFKCAQQDAKNGPSSIGDCQAHIGHCYLTGELVEKNSSIALYWFNKAWINLQSSVQQISITSEIKKLEKEDIEEATEEAVKLSISHFMSKLPPAFLDKDQQESKKNVTPELKHERKDDDPGFEIKHSLHLPPGHESSQPTNIPDLEPVPEPLVLSQLKMFHNRLGSWVCNLPLKQNDLSGPVNIQLQEQLAMIQFHCGLIQIQLIKAQQKLLSSSAPADEKHGGKASQSTNISEPELVSAPSMQDQLILFENQLKRWEDKLTKKENDLSGLVNLQLQE